jgi:hypothetical protein
MGMIQALHRGSPYLLRFPGLGSGERKAFQVTWKSENLIARPALARAKLSFS